MPPIVSSSGSHFGSTLPHILGASGKTTITCSYKELVARLLATTALCVQIQTSLKKYRMSDISKGVADTF
jgi:hypothetical protein